MLGNILQAIAAFFGFAQKVAEEVHDSNERKAGAAEQQAADQTKTLTDVKEANDAENRVAGAGDAGLDQLRSKWTAPS